MKRKNSFGESHLSIVDKFGLFLSKRAILNKLKNNKKDLEILEIGCGYWARNLLFLEDRATKLVGIDFRISNSVKAMSKFTSLECDAVHGLKIINDQKFDVVMLISVLEHLSDPVEILKNCHAILKPDGVLLINVPTWIGKIFLEFSAFKLGLSPLEEMDDHKMYYDKKDLWPLLVKAGFYPSKIKMNYHKFKLNLFVTLRR
jgi:SAM-dependent methyltransferase